MLSSFIDIEKSKNFPFDKIIGCLNWRHDYTKTNFEEGLIYNQKNEAYPIFSIEKKKYVSCFFGKEKFFSAQNSGFQNFSDYFNTLNKIKELKVERTATPIDLELIKGSLYGLIPWIDGPDLQEKYFQKNFNFDHDFYEMALAAEEIHRYEFIHLDLNPSNFVSSDKIFIIDLSIAKPHFRKKRQWFNERTCTFCWAPEVEWGGQVSKKSSVYSLGEAYKFLLGKDKETSIFSQKYEKLINRCMQKNPNKRPSFEKILLEIESLIQTQL